VSKQNKPKFFPTEASRKDPTMSEPLTNKIKTPAPLKAITAGHKVLLHKLRNKHHDILFAIGPAGTGKTYICVRDAIDRFLAGEVEKIVITRPNVASGDDIGFLPGTLNEKMAPWTRPVVDVFMEYFSAQEFRRMLDAEEVEIAPLAFMRGRTFKNAAIIGDEMQNATPEQMKMFLTRIGAGSYMVITGDMEQFDRRELGTISGLADIVRRMDARKAANDTAASLPGFITRTPQYRYERIGMVRLGRVDVCRHEVISEVLGFYDEEYDIAA
jgi:phosphate starvation-inducible protein PhoH